MKLIDIWNSSPKPTISFELFPARSEKAAVSLEKTIDALTALKPDFVSVTFGAGGSTREGSRQLIEKLKHEKGLEVIAFRIHTKLFGEAGYLPPRFVLDENPVFQPIFSLFGFYLTGEQYFFHSRKFWR